MPDETIRTVDFIPQYNMLGDIKKVSEYNFAIQNARILPVITLICMERGSNVLYPDMGLHEVFKSLPYKEMSEVYATLESISGHIYHFSGITARVYIDEADPENDFIKGVLALRIDIEGVVAPLTIGVNKQNGFFVRHPSVFLGNLKDFKNGT
jgi:hypothetical protein